VDFGDGVLVITYSKFNQSRELPLHPSTVCALRDYAGLRDELCGEPKSASFFVSALGTRLVYVTVQQVFSRLVRAAGLRARSASCRPRIHDTRHYADGWVMRPAVRFGLAEAAGLVLPSA
jgi:integrase/recombinase XerD